MKVGFYTFGGPTIGTGHLLRCLALSQWLENSISPLEIVFELIDMDPKGVSVARDIISSRFGGSIQIHQDCRVPGNLWDVLVVDCLRVDLKVMQDLGRRARCLVSIDDTGAGRVAADIALNPLYRGRKASISTRLKEEHQGAKCQILAPLFSVDPSPWRETPANLLVMQGGADPYSLVPVLIEELKPLLWKHPELTINVVTGAAFLADQALEKAVIGLGERVNLYRNVMNMPLLLRKMDLAVSSAGVTPFELAAMGIPAILVTGEAKEVETADDIAQTGAAVSLGLYDSDSGQHLREVLEDLLANQCRRLGMRNAALNNLDGRMGERLVHMIVKCLSECSSR